jgi:hypothetical protein
MLPAVVRVGRTCQETTGDEWPEHADGGRVPDTEDTRELSDGGDIRPDLGREAEDIDLRRRQAKAVGFFPSRAVDGAAEADQQRKRRRPAFSGRVHG